MAEPDAERPDLTTGPAFDRAVEKAVRRLNLAGDEVLGAAWREVEAAEGTSLLHILVQRRVITRADAARVHRHVEQNSASEQRRTLLAAHEPASAEPGSQVDERAHSPRYRQGCLLGEGGMGRVWSYEDTALGRPVAIKLAHATVDARQLGREARIAARLEHPNIVPVYDIGRLDGEAFYAMREVHGRPFSEILAEDGVDLTDALVVFGKVCDAMAYAHSRGVIHRDLKPANVMVNQFGEVVVMDWGLARLLNADVDSSEAQLAARHAPEAAAVPDAAPARAAAEGTPAYMPPEQARGDVAEMDERSDVYALGAILYEILAGCPPYEAPTPSALLRELLHGVLIPPRQRAPERRVPWELERVALRALSRSAERRYATVGALRSDIEAFVRGQPLPSLSYGLAWHVHRFYRRNRRRIALAGGVVLLLLGAFVLTRAFDRRERDRLAEVERQRQTDEQVRQAAKLAARADALIAERHQISLRGVPAIDAARNQLKATPERLRTSHEGVERSDVELVRLRQSALRRSVACLNEAVASYVQALQHVPSHACRGALLEVYWEQLRDYERLQREEASYFARMIEVYDTDGSQRDRLVGDGSLALTAAPTGLMRVYRYEVRAEDGCWQLEERPRAERAADGGTVQLPMGSYLARIEAEGSAPLLYPFHLERGEQLRDELLLYPPSSVEPGFVLVTHGTCRVPAGEPPLSAPPYVHVLKHDVLMAARETTFGEYLEFLNEVDREFPGFHELYAPQVDNLTFVNRNAAGRWELVPGPLAQPNLPVHSVSWFSADGYCAWLNRRSGVAARQLAIARRTLWEPAHGQTLTEPPPWQRCQSFSRGAPVAPLTEGAWTNGQFRLTAPGALLVRTDFRTETSFALELELTPVEVGRDGLLGIRFGLGATEPETVLVGARPDAIALFGWRGGNDAPSVPIGRLGLGEGRQVLRLEVVGPHIRVALGDHEVGFNRSNWSAPEQRQSGMAIELYLQNLVLDVHRVTQFRALDAPAIAGQIEAEGGEYRLPDGAEWCRAALGGGMRLYPWGEQWSWEACNCWRSAIGDAEPRLVPSGTFPVDCSPFGAFDMCGNLREWLRDGASPYFAIRVQVGGSYASGDANWFYVGLPSGHTPETRNPQVGFRVIKTLPSRRR